MTEDRIVVGVAMGEDNDAALEFAAAEGVRRQCHVHLVYALHPVWVGPADAVDLRLVDGELRNVGVQFLQRCQQQVEQASQHALNVSTEILHGPVVSSLNDQSQHAALVVLQHHRMGMTHRVRTMSTTNGVAARAHSPVVAVPDTWRENGEHPPVVAVGVEDAKTSTRVLTTAFEEARRLDARVEMVRAWFYSAAFDGEVYAGQAGVLEAEEVRKSVHEDFDPVIADFPDVASDIIVTHGRPADVLVARAAHARLLVVGRHEPALPFGSHLGPITRGVLAHASCPVMVVDPRRSAES
jgi:nucleotide-binding universal stress UspA family protein